MLIQPLPALFYCGDDRFPMQLRLTKQKRQKLVQKAGGLILFIMPSTLECRVFLPEYIQKGRGVMKVKAAAGFFLNGRYNLMSEIAVKVQVEKTPAMIWRRVNIISAFIGKGNEKGRASFHFLFIATYLKISAAFECILEQKALVITAGCVVKKVIFVLSVFHSQVVQNQRGRSQAVIV